MFTSLLNVPSFITTFALHTHTIIQHLQGNIFRRRPKTFIECDLKGPCFVTIYAARFNDNAATTPSRHPDQQGNLNIILSGSGRDGHLRNQTTLANGMVFRNFTFGSLPDGRLGDIGGHRIVCFTVEGHTKCKTPPLCITVKVRGSKPQFLAPTPPMKLDSVYPCARVLLACDAYVNAYVNRCILLLLPHE